jgi:hypothetical protein
MLHGVSRGNQNKGLVLHASKLQPWPFHACLQARQGYEAQIAGLRSRITQLQAALVDASGAGDPPAQLPEPTSDGDIAAYPPQAVSWRGELMRENALRCEVCKKHSVLTAGTSCMNFVVTMPPVFNSSMHSS